MRIKFLLTLGFFLLLLSVGLRKAPCYGGIIDSQDKWKEFKDCSFGFKLSYPAAAKITKRESLLRIDLSLDESTDLADGYILIRVRDTKKESEEITPPVIESSEEIFINGINFKRIFWQEGAAGSIYYVIQYIATDKDKHFDLKCVLRRINRGVFLSEKVKESSCKKEMAVLEEIINTFEVFHQENPCFGAERFIGNQPFAKRVIGSKLEYLDEGAALVEVVNEDMVYYNVLLRDNVDCNRWQVKSARELGEDVIEHN